MSKGITSRTITIPVQFCISHPEQHQHIFANERQDISEGRLLPYCTNTCITQTLYCKRKYYILTGATDLCG